MKRMVFVLGFLVAAGMAFGDDTADTFKAKCKGCHGEDGKAQTKIGRTEKIPDFTTPDWQAKHSDEEIRKTIENGSEDNPKMKPFKDKLTPQEIGGLVKYVRSFNANKKK